MIEPTLFEAITRTGFAHRGRRQTDGNYTYMLRDESGAVSVPARDWDRIGANYMETVRWAKGRALIIAFGAPWLIMIFALFVAPIFPHIVAITLLILGLASWVGSWMVWFPWQIYCASRDAERQLRGYPPTKPVPLEEGRRPRVLQIIFLVLVGPNLILSLIGEIGGPDTFRNTPMVGAGMGPWQYTALCILAVWHLWPLLVAYRREVR